MDAPRKVHFEDYSSFEKGGFGVPHGLGFRV